MIQKPFRIENNSGLACISANDVFQTALQSQVGERVFLLQRMTETGCSDSRMTARTCCFGYGVNGLRPGVFIGSTDCGDA